MKYNRLNDNDFLTDLNMNNATDRQKIALLNRIIDNELEKSDADMALVDECMAFIADLDRNQFQKTDEQLTANLRKIMWADSPKSTAVQTSAPRYRMKTYLRSASILFAATLAIAALLVIAANIFPTNDPAASNTVSAQTASPRNVVICIDGIESAVYSSVDDLLEGEKLHIRYPSRLPEGIRLEQVDLWWHENGEMKLSFAFNTTDLQFQVCSNALFSDTAEGKQELSRLYAGELAFTLYRLNGNTYQAICTAGEYTYSITCIHYENLISMLNQFRTD